MKSVVETKNDYINWIQKKLNLLGKMQMHLVTVWIITP